MLNHWRGEEKKTKKTRSQQSYIDTWDLPLGAKKIHDRV